eukprot:TRINITY_DN15608_c0_g1_i1.p1 TRINITY_DN15608_c0_g1~~TRINITY_DN15608_c0_g1_i1.p1  ORF type:complete len:536 (-),score=205.38 TRINITY_DN15608_c0_g1_i1:54-1640(-)
MSKAEDKSEKWVQAQRKAFTHWVNTCLKVREERVETLEEGFNNGLRLIALVEILTKEALRKRHNSKVALKVHKVNNCFLALEHLKDPELGNVKGLTIGAEDFVDGRTNMILGFCWQLLRKFSGVGKGDGSGAGAGSFESGLLDWLKQTLASYEDINLDKGFKSEGFSNGKIFLALNHAFNPDSVDYKSYDAANQLTNCQDALRIGEESAGVPATIDPEDLASGQASDKEIILYLSLWYETFKGKQGDVTAESLQSKLKAVEEEITIITAENEELRLRQSSLESQTSNLSEKLTLLKEEQENLSIQLREELETELRTTEESFREEKEANELELSKLRETVQMDGKSSEEKRTQLQNAVNETNNEREKLTEELKAFREKIEREKEELEKENAALEKRIRDFEKDHSALEEAMRKRQAEQGQNVFNLRKEVMKHLGCMDEWKIFLDQQGMTYESEDLAVHMETSPDFMEMDTKQKIETVSQALSEEDAQLAALTKKKQSGDDSEEEEAPKITKSPSKKSASVKKVDKKSKK